MASLEARTSRRSVNSSETSVSGLMQRDELTLVPVAALGFEEYEPREHPGEERNPKINEDALGDGADRDSEVHIAEMNANERR